MGSFVKKIETATDWVLKIVLLKMVVRHHLLTLILLGLVAICQCDGQMQVMKMLFGQPACSSSLTNMGIDPTKLKYSVGHGIHSITVRDIRYYFEPSFPELNSIPTVNPILNAFSPVLPSAPLGAKAATPGMRVMDEVMSNDDGTDNYLIQGMSRLEKIGHGLHMLELWQRTAQAYQLVKLDPPNKAVCTCVTNDRANGLLQHMETISSVLRNWSNATALNQLYGGSGQDFQKVHYHFHYETDKMPDGIKFLAKRSVSGKVPDMGLPSKTYHYKYDQPGPGDGSAMEKLPSLEDQSSWVAWKKMLRESMMKDDEIRTLAIYLYCKANN